MGCSHRNRRKERSVVRHHTADKVISVSPKPTKNGVLQAAAFRDLPGRPVPLIDANRTSA